MPGALPLASPIDEEGGGGRGRAGRRDEGGGRREAEGCRVGNMITADRIAVCKRTDRFGKEGPSQALTESNVCFSLYTSFDSDIVAT